MTQPTTTAKNSKEQKNPTNEFFEIELGTRKQRPVVHARARVKTITNGNKNMLVYLATRTFKRLERLAFSFTLAAGMGASGCSLDVARGVVVDDLPAKLQRLFGEDARGIVLQLGASGAELEIEDAEGDVLARLETEIADDGARVDVEVKDLVRFELDDGSIAGLADGIDGKITLLDEAEPQIEPGTWTSVVDVAGGGLEVVAQVEDELYGEDFDSSQQEQALNGGSEGCARAAAKCIGALGRAPIACAISSVCGIAVIVGCGPLGFRTCPEPLTCSSDGSTCQ